MTAVFAMDACRTPVGTVTGGRRGGTRAATMCIGAGQGIATWRQAG